MRVNAVSAQSNLYCVSAELVQNPDDTTQAGMPIGAIIGGIVAAVVVVAILAGVGFFLLRYAYSIKFSSWINSDICEYNV